MSCITFHLESLLRDEARALAGQGMVPSAGRPARTHSVSPHPSSRDGTDRALPNSSPEAPTYSDPWLAAWRESQGQPVDAVPGDGLPARFTVNREGDIVDLEIGEIDPVLTAQLAMGIR